MERSSSAKPGEFHYSNSNVYVATDVPQELSGSLLTD